MEKLLRPYGVIVEGQLELGIELLLHGNTIREIRRHTGVPDPYIVSTAFVNAHSHLEYRGLQNDMQEPDWWPWLREITAKKPLQANHQVQADCALAAQENRRTGVALIAEHNDRGHAAHALHHARIAGVLFQETITVGQRDPISAIHDKTHAANEAAKAFHNPAFPTPHAYYTVHTNALRAFANTNRPLSIHVAEHHYENTFAAQNKGPIADLYAQRGWHHEPTGMSVVQSLAALGLAKPNVQWVHCCAIDYQDLDTIAQTGVSIAHCPRSNARLQCPPCPLREILDARIPVGLGMDSPASSGPIDVFAEMRAAIQTSHQRGKPVTADEIWRLATDLGAASLPIPTPPWTITPGANTPLLAIHIPGALATQDIIDRATPEHVQWIHAPTSQP